MAKLKKGAKISAVPSPEKGKGKEILNPEAMPVESNDLLRLAEKLIKSAHLLAPGNEDSNLLELSNSVLKSSFDRGE